MLHAHTQKQVCHNTACHNIYSQVKMLSAPGLGKMGKVTLIPAAFDPLSPSVTPRVPKEHLWYLDSDKIQAIIHSATRS